MGDFTAHCAVSGLPLWGRSVVMVGLAESGYKEFREGAVTVTDLFKLAGLPIYGKYNDYGFINEIDTPFSDDLGLLLAGVPAVQLSLLPRKEAAVYRRSGEQPPSWRAMHTADDKPETLWPSSRVLMADVLDKFDQLFW